MLDSLVKRFKDISEEDLMAGVRHSDPVDPVVMGVTIDQNNKGVDAPMEGDREFLGIDSKELAWTEPVTHRSMG